MEANYDQQLVDRLAAETRAQAEHKLALALDFDGVCKLFTQYKHQILSTCLFTNLRQLQRVSFAVYWQNYCFINFQSAEYGGKERFVCADALVRRLADQGYDCALPDLHAAVAEIKARNEKVNETTLAPYRDRDQIACALTWSRQANDLIARLTEIGLTPGINENILIPFRQTADYYVVSTAPEANLQPSLEKESIDFIRRYFGQDTATKAESLHAICLAGYRMVLMFGDSVEDARASQWAADHAPDDVFFMFIPVIPDDEEACFVAARKIIDLLLAGDQATARQMGKELAQRFQGREVGF